MKKSKGFTLIELLVVIAIIGLLATIVLVSVNTTRKKARDARRLSDLRQVAVALEMFWDNNRFYPGVANCNVTNYTGTLTSCLVGTGAAPCNVAYMSAVPVDPLNTVNNVYMYATDVATGAQRYVLRAYLESHHSALDTDVDNVGGNPVYNCACGTNGASEREYCLQP